MAAPTDEEKKILVEFRKTLSDLTLTSEQNEDIQLLRWLRAREYDLKKSENLFRDNLKWRKENGIDEIMSFKPPDHFYKMYKWEITGYTADGCPVVMMPYGAYDIKKAVQRGEKELFLKFFFKWYEYMLHEMKGKIDPFTNQPVTQFIGVFDFAKYSFGQLTVLGATASVITTIKVFECNYPEVLRNAYLINAPKIFSFFFALLKKNMSARTLGKMKIFTDAEESKWRQDVFENIPKNLILPHYGGTATHSAVNQYGHRGAKIQPNLNYGGYDKASDIVQDDEDYEEIKIPAGEKLNLEFDVENSNTRISWCFKIENYDIGFSLIHKDKEVVPIDRYDSTGETPLGSYECKAEGKYIMCFDNSFSRMRAKTVFYSVNFSNINE